MDAIHLRFLQFWIKRRWSQHTQPWDTQIQLDSELLTHLRWFNRREILQGVPLHLPEATLFFFLHRCVAYRMGSQSADSSSLRSVVTSRVFQTSGWNWKQYSWPYFSGTSVAQQTVRVYCDNSTAVANFRKQEGTHSISLFNKTLELFHLLDKFAILFFPTHLPGAWKDNLSRINSSSTTEWRIPK